MPRYKEIAEKYPDMDDEDVFVDLSAQADKLEEVSNKLGDLSEKSSQYMQYPKVAKEMQIAIDIMMSCLKFIFCIFLILKNFIKILTKVY